MKSCANSSRRSITCDADRANRQRALADVVQFLPLSEVHRHRDDLGAVLLGEPWNGDRGVEAAGIRQNDAFHRISCPFTIELNFFSSVSAAAGPRQTSRIVSSPRNRAGDLRQLRAVDPFGQPLGLAAVGAHDDERIDTLDGRAAAS